MCDCSVICFCFSHPWPPLHACGRGFTRCGAPSGRWWGSSWAWPPCGWPAACCPLLCPRPTPALLILPGPLPPRPHSAAAEPQAGWWKPDRSRTPSAGGQPRPLPRRSATPGFLRLLHLLDLLSDPRFGSHSPHRVCRVRQGFAQGWRGYVWG